MSGAPLQVYKKDKGRNSSSAELASLEETMQEAAEQKAAYAGMSLLSPESLNTKELDSSSS